VAVSKVSAARRRASGHRTRAGRQRRARTRSRILAAALRIFADQGPDRPVIDDFIRAAGVARGTFYNHFRNTSELFEATSKWLEEDMIVSIEQEISPSKDPVERLTNGVRLWLLRAADDAAWCSFVVRSRRRSPLVEKQLTGDLRSGRRKRVFSFPSIEVARDMTVGTVLEAMTRMMHERVPGTYVDQVTRTVLRGLGLADPAIDAAISRPVPPLRRPALRVPGTTR
jgi:AcrR family transcriptional regulator